MCGAALCLFPVGENSQGFHRQFLYMATYDFCSYVLLSKNSSFTRYALSHSDLRVKGETRIWKYFLFVVFAEKGETSKNDGFIGKIGTFHQFLPISSGFSSILHSTPCVLHFSGTLAVSTGSIPVKTAIGPGGKVKQEVLKLKHEVLKVRRGLLKCD